MRDFLTFLGILIMILGCTGSLMVGAGFLFFLVGCFCSVIFGCIFLGMAKIIEISNYNKKQLDLIIMKLEQTEQTE